ncbi:MAG TPA: hypothetical protein VII73_00535 [Caulobacteraceae bacterium]
MKRTVTRLFDTRAQAEGAVRDLEAMGIPASDLSLVSGRGASEETRSFAEDHDAAHGAGKGVAAGGVVGAGVGLLAGLGLLAIPGLGPVVAAGWLVSTAVGAVAGAAAGGAAGGLLGALKDAGVGEDDAHVYAEGVRRGGTLVSARAEESDAARVEQLLDAQGGVDATKRGAVYREQGWTSFDEKAAPDPAQTPPPLI